MGNPKFLTAAGCPYKGFYHPPPQKNATDFCTVLEKIYVRRQNKAKLLPNGGKTFAIRWQTFVLCTEIFFPPHQNICTAHKKISFVLQKNSICIAKIAISKFSHSLGLLLSFWDTFSYFSILSQLLAH